MADTHEALVSLAAAKLGYSQVKPDQLRAVRSFLEGNDVFVCLPTGAGKSLCYAILPSVHDSFRRGGYGQPSDSDAAEPAITKVSSVVLIVSPLIALMKDQVECFTRKGLKAVYIDSSDEEAKIAAMSGEFQLVYISPETLINDRQWRRILESDYLRCNLVALVIDEAHCVRKWYVMS